MQSAVDTKAKEQELEDAHAVATSANKQVSVSVLGPSMSQVDFGRIWRGTHDKSLARRGLGMSNDVLFIPRNTFSKKLAAPSLVRDPSHLENGHFFCKACRDGGR